MAKLAVATLDDFEAMKNDLGQVPMRFLVSTLGEFKGDIRGAEPATALNWYNRGLAEPAAGAVKTKPAPDAGLQISDEDRRRGEVEIPAKWRELHHLALIPLAQNILGNKDALNKEQAMTAVQMEVDRRSALAASGGGLTTQNAPTTS